MAHSQKQNTVKWRGGFLHKFFYIFLIDVFAFADTFYNPNIGKINPMYQWCVGFDG